MASKVLLFLSLLAAVPAQQVGTLTPELHPSLPWQKCTKSGGCVTQCNGKVVLDANWRWVHTTSGWSECLIDQKWDPSICPDPVTCAQNCAVEGAAYSASYGITVNGNALKMKFVTPQTSGKNIGSRVYLLADDSTYDIFKLKNQEFTFDVDVSQLPCGLNGALYFSAMDADGGMSKYPNNKAGAKYGTGYCDAQCPTDIQFIDGEANTGYGSCCDEMDVWEANSISTAYTPHPCTSTGQTRCDNTTCPTTCDQTGCDFNPYRMGDKTFYGNSHIVDTSKNITVVTQFITADGTAAGTLSEIRRIYVQDGKVIQNSKTNIPGISAYDSISDAFCSAQKTAFNDTNMFAQKGGLGKMSKAFDAGMVLIMSIWDDHESNMLWLDSNYPTSADPTSPGIARGTCATNSETPAELEANLGAQVIYSNIRFGDKGSTYGNSSTTTPT
ncbi:Exoglucanase 1, partial [Ceratobasidium sp. UAMH 11750]